MAQDDMPRKGKLGAYLAPLGSEQAQTDYDGTIGIYIPQVVEGLTAAELGVQAEDVLTHINGQPVSSYSDVVAQVSQWRGGDAVQLTVWRAGKTKTLTGKVVPAPFPSSETMNYEYGHVDFEEGKIRTILQYPKNAESPLPTIYFIQGYPCQSVDGWPEYHPYAKLIDGLVAKGYAVFRMEKPGVGDSYGHDCMEIDFDTEMDGFRAGMKKLLTLDNVDADKIFLVGHSLGGLQVPVLGAEFDTKGVIAYGTAVRPWHDYLLELVQLQNPMLGGDYGDNAALAETFRPYFYQYFYEGKALHEIVPEEVAELLDQNFGFDGEGHFIQRHESFWQTINAYNFFDYWDQVEEPVLALHGEVDVQVINAVDLKMIAAIANRSEPANGTFHQFDGTDHSMIKVGSLENRNKVAGTPAYGELLQTSYNTDVIEVIHKWIQEQL